SGTGSGCSAYIAQPTWQKTSVCRTRSVADVSAVADPATGVAVYDSFNQPGWQELGGTSASAPIVAAIYALAGGASGTAAANVWGHTSFLWDIVAGTNSSGPCTTAQCKSGHGYDGPTGLGTPNGAGSF